MSLAASLPNAARSLSEPSDMFSPDHYTAVRRPLAEAETLPAWCYTSERFYQREVERIFMKVWNFLGRADRIPNPGDYFTLEFAGIPLIIARGDDGNVRAFANSCRHRGSLVALGEGSCRAFKCPYHSWAFGLDGRLLSAPSMEQTLNFDKADYGLTEIRLESWGGFIFVNFDRDAPDLLTFLGDLPQRLASYNYEEMVCVRRVEYELTCNWKIYVENAMEAYHVPYVHKSTLQRQKGPTAQPIETEGEWVGLFKEHTGSRALLAGETGFPPIPSLSGPAAVGTHYPLIYPSTMFGATIDCMWWLELHPIAADRTKLIVGSAFPKEVVARPDFEEVVTRYYRRWDISIPEDNEISDLQQRGLSSPFYREGRFSHLEPLVHAIDNWVLDRVLDPA
ncbi:MAG: aromatic ring-hydroxylating dioxygenase subunit alpha [Alphaproteobacteria bacterium]|nr:aromatic ring-hydroxylating dioxygenase subunit alpha [Alphaproteobacteria bacterium]MBU0798808.1 aromatic ring-hydroxylating dioxygenase subunit alpha [Alphaproteobacteria bacterium]MBU0886992.1 aromatic ring-hydroxylating dioxygenase subunit alpha [Alphaproteobacteria bacterium]MBU1813152.1 aromatic ring-hydroxylating dioxygenase subunit alpha [Alphaproteobacteria bacterium]